MVFLLKRFPFFFYKQGKRKSETYKSEMRKKEGKSDRKKQIQKRKKKGNRVYEKCKKKKKKSAWSEKGKEKEEKRETGGSGTRFPKKAWGESSFFLCKYYL